MTNEDKPLKSGLTLLRTYVAIQSPLTLTGISVQPRYISADDNKLENEQSSCPLLQFFRQWLLQDDKVCSNCKRNPPAFLGVTVSLFYSLDRYKSTVMVRLFLSRDISDILFFFYFHRISV